jgi:prophage antirepressor-like protein
MTHLIPAEFFGTQLSIIDHDGKRWLTAEQVGLALGYNGANASAGVRNLYNRHQDEFTEADTCRIKLMSQSTSGVNQERDVRIFSATGCVALGWLANTPRARQFKAWAKEHLAAAITGVPAPTRQNFAGGKTIITREMERAIIQHYLLDWVQADIARKFKISCATCNQILTGKYQFSLHAGETLITVAQARAVARRRAQWEYDRLAAAQQRAVNVMRCTAGNALLACALDEYGLGMERALAAGAPLPVIGDPEKATPDPVPAVFRARARPDEA